VLGRESDPAGLTFWNNSLANGRQSGSTISESFFFSPEYIGRNRTNEQFLDDLYKTCMGRPPDSAGFAYWLNRLELGVTRRNLMNSFLQSAEFRGICAQYGITVGRINLRDNADRNASVTMFVHRCYDVFLDRKPDTAGLNHWTGRILNNGVSGQRIAESFVFSVEFRNRQMSDEEFIRYMYRGMMGREFDTAGLNFWLGQMRRQSTNEQGRRVVFNGFANSPEFRAICARFGV